MAGETMHISQRGELPSASAIVNAAAPETASRTGFPAPARNTLRVANPSFVAAKVAAAPG